MHKTIMVLSLASFLITATATAETFVINPDGSGDYATIQAGINSALDGDIIELTDGIFIGAGNRDINFLGKMIIVRSQSGNPETCTIDCQASEAEQHRAFSFVSGENNSSVLNGVTIRNGWITHPGYGGAIECDGSSSPSISSCIFTGIYGGAISIRNGSAPEISDCVFRENQALTGGGIDCYTASFFLHNSDFTDNTAENFGAAIHGWYSNAVITSCTFMRNTAEIGGAVNFGEYTDADVRDCQFVDNSAGSSGGAVSLFFLCNGYFENCTFVGNTAWEGGAVRNGKISRTVFKNCTLYGNGALYGTVKCGNYEVIFENTIIAFSTVGPALHVPYDHAGLTCCNLYGNAGGDWVEYVADQYGINGNISEDPLFCDPETGDFTLMNNSPCAPYSAPNPECDLIGAWPVGCQPTPVLETTWGLLKAISR